jgi:hypothetical protein
MNDPCTGRPIFTTRCIELCCAKCKEDGKSHECVHMLHLVPRWQSAEKHRKLKIMMQVRLFSFRMHTKSTCFGTAAENNRACTRGHLPEAKHGCR